LVWFGLIVVLVAVLLVAGDDDAVDVWLDYEAVIEDVENGAVDSVRVENNQLTLTSSPP